jgi:hypothetical protein
MAVEFAALAASLVGKVLLPYAKVGLKKIGDELRKKADAAVESQATSLTAKVWEKVAGLFKSDRDRFALEQFQENPDDAAGVFTKALEKKLQEEPQQAEELQKLLETPLAKGSGATLQNIMADVFGFVDARGAVISGGQVAGAIINAPRSPSADRPKTTPPPPRT